MNEQDNRNRHATRSGTPDGAAPADMADRLKDDAAALADTARQEASHIKQEAEAEIGALAEEGKRRAAEVASEAKGFAEEQKDRFAEQIGGVASALHKVAKELDAENAPTAGYAHRIADGMDRFTRDLKARDVDGIVSVAEDFGRRQPAAFMAAAAIAGFTASRFLRASGERRHADNPPARREPEPAAHAPTQAGASAAGRTDTGQMRRPYQ